MWGRCIHACVGEAATKSDNHKCVVVSDLPEGKRRWAGLRSSGGKRRQRPCWCSRAGVGKFALSSRAEPFNCKNKAPLSPSFSVVQLCS